MQQWFISHSSALEFWRREQAKIATRGNVDFAGHLPATMCDASAIRESSLLGLTKPLHILVGNDTLRKSTANLHCHIDSGHFPKGSFVQLKNGILISSPELCIVQMAKELSLAELTALIFELCGTYRINPTDIERGFRDDSPLTNIEKIRQFTLSTTGHIGLKSTRNSLKFAVEGSASPMETILTMLLTLPYRLGGYSLPIPKLNYPVETLSMRGKPKAKPKICDLFWPDKLIDVEYDSAFYHTQAERIDKDAARRNALTATGIVVVTVTKQQIINAQKFRTLVGVLSKLLDRRLKMPKDFAAKHVRLRRQLMSKPAGLH